MSRDKAVRKALARAQAKNGWEPMRPTSGNAGSPLPQWATRAFRNNHFAVLINDKAKTTKGPATLAYVVPFHAGRDVFWTDLQRIKNEIFGSEALAIQYFPRESALVDVVNVYWLFVYPEGILPEYLRDNQF